MIILISFAIFILLTTLIYLFVKLFFRRRIEIDERAERLKRYGEYNSLDATLEKSFYERFIRSSKDQLFKLLDIGVMSLIKRKLRTKLMTAGYSTKEEINQYFARNIILIVIGAGAVTAISYFFLLERSLMKSAYILFFSIVFISLVLHIKLLNQITERKKTIQKELLDAIDIISVSVEAGLSFDGAMNRLVHSLTSDLTDEFRLTLKEMQLGIQRKAALNKMAERCDISDVKTFVGAINQGEELGVSISNILKIQSKEMREKRYQRIREKSMKAPIKLLFPIIIFIFPAIFYILLGPSIIKLMEFLG